MDQSITHAAMLANFSALRLLLTDALVRAMDAETAMRGGQVNQAIGTAIGIDALLHDASALHAAAVALHRQGRA